MKVTFTIQDEANHQVMIMTGPYKTVACPYGWVWKRGYGTRGAWVTTNKRAFARYYRQVSKTSLFAGCYRRRYGDNEPARRIA